MAPASFQPSRSGATEAFAPPDDLILVRHDRTLRLIRPAEITCIRAEGNYSIVSLRERKDLLVYRTLDQWKKRLPEASFVRPHRSLIINLTHLVALEFDDRNTGRMFLNGRTDPIPLGRTALHRLRTLIQSV